MNLASIIIQLVALCNSMGENTVATCQYEMQKCAVKYYSAQQGDVSDICTKKYLEGK